MDVLDLVVKRGCEIDSRKITPGMIFFALKGERVDGHAFLSEVAQKGAFGAVVSTDFLKDSAAVAHAQSLGLQLYPVEDVLGCLQTLAARRIAAHPHLTIIGVTGSVGKTTMKEFMATLLQAKLRVIKSPGNANSQVSLPLVVLNSSLDCDVLVLEMGMTHPGEIKRLVHIAPPTIALITRIALAHAAFFESIEGIAAAKQEIFSHPKTEAFFASHLAAPFIQKPDLRIYGEGGDIQLERREEKWVLIDAVGESPPFSLPFTATHLVENFLGAAAVARYLRLSWSDILSAVSSLKPHERRFERVERDGVVFINDAYNANAVSMCAALNNLPVGKRRIAVLGEMKELGKFSVGCHREVGEEAARTVDFLLCYGPECLPMGEAFALSGKPVAYFNEMPALRNHLFQLLEPGDVVLLKGSKSKCLWELLE